MELFRVCCQISPEGGQKSNNPLSATDSSPWEQLFTLCQNADAISLNVLVIPSVYNKIAVLLQNEATIPAVLRCVRSLIVVLATTGAACPFKETNTLLVALTTAIASSEVNPQTKERTNILREMLGPMLVLYHQTLPPYESSDHSVLVPYAVLDAYVTVCQVANNTQGVCPGRVRAMLRGLFHVPTLNYVLLLAEADGSALPKDLSAIRVKEVQDFLLQLRSGRVEVITVVTESLVKALPGEVFLLTRWVESLEGTKHSDMCLSHALDIYRRYDAISLMVDATKHGSKFRKFLDRTVDKAIAKGKADLALRAALLDIQAILTSPARLESLWEYVLSTESDHAEDHEIWCCVVRSLARVQEGLLFFRSLEKGIRAITDKEAACARGLSPSKLFLVTPWKCFIENTSQLSCVLAEITAIATPRCRFTSVVVAQLCKDITPNEDTHSVLGTWVTSMLEGFVSKWLRRAPSTPEVAEASWRLLQLSFQVRVCVCPNVFAWLELQCERVSEIRTSLALWREAATVLEAKGAAESHGWALCGIATHLCYLACLNPSHDTILEEIRGEVTALTEHKEKNVALGTILATICSLLPQAVSLANPRKRSIQSALELSGKVCVADIAAWVQRDVAGEEPKGSYKQRVCTLCDVYAAQGSQRSLAPRALQDKWRGSQEDAVAIRDYYLDAAIRNDSDSANVLSKLCGIFGGDFVLVVLVRLLDEIQTPKASDDTLKGVFSTIIHHLITTPAEVGVVDGILSLLIEKLGVLRKFVDEESLALTFCYVDRHWRSVDADSIPTIRSNVKKLLQQALPIRLSVETLALAQRCEFVIPEPPLDCAAVRNRDLVCALAHTNALTHVKGLRSVLVACITRAGEDKGSSLALLRVLASHITKPSNALDGAVAELVSEVPWCPGFPETLRSVLHNQDVVLSTPTMGKIICGIQRERTGTEGLLHTLVLARKQAVGPLLPCLMVALHSTLGAQLHSKNPAWLSTLRVYRDMTRVPGLTHNDVRALLVSAFGCLQQQDGFVRRSGIREVALCLDGLLDLYFHGSSELAPLRGGAAAASGSGATLFVLDEILAVYRQVRPKQKD